MRSSRFSAGYLTGIMLSMVFGFFMIFRLSTPEMLSIDEFIFTDLNGKVVNANDFAGKTVVLNFWATWCGPCLKELPGLERAIRKLKNPGVVFLVASNEPIGKISKLKQKMELGLDLYHVDQKGSPFKIKSFPVTYVFNRKGQIVYHRFGAFEWDDEKVLEKLKQLIR